MKLRQYVYEHYLLIDRHAKIKEGIPKFSLTVTQRMDWVRTDDTLYNIAIEAGVEDI